MELSIFYLAQNARPRDMSIWLILTNANTFMFFFLYTKAFCPTYSTLSTLAPFLLAARFFLWPLSKDTAL